LILLSGETQIEKLIIFKYYAIYFYYLF